MVETEFDVIRRYFTRQPVSRKDVLAGIGDDAAVLQLPSDRELLVCIDTLVAGVHFPVVTPAAAIGHKALAVNLSDLAAMGAEPAWATLALTLPDSDPVWLAAFASGFFALAGRHGVQLIGGDTTCGPMSVTVQAHGFAPPGQALRRIGAQPGDHIYVTGTLGDAGLALRFPEAAAGGLRARLDYPEPRIAAGSLLRGLASAAIDISDGLLADLGHLLEGDDLGASLRVDELPRSGSFVAALQGLDSVPPGQYYELPLSSGDDYELCFTVPECFCAEVERCLGELPCGCTAIGIIEAQPGVRCYLQDGSDYQPRGAGYLHFQGGDHG
jgi:thiamine-monophosphate kinase